MIDEVYLNQRMLLNTSLGQESSNTSEKKQKRTAWTGLNASSYS